MLVRPLRLAGRDLRLQASVGIAVAETGEETAEMLLRNADLAMYKAKAGGRGGAVRFESVMYVALVRRIEDEGLLRLARSRGELVVDYQPTVDLDSGAIVGAEALVRWQHPHRGLLLPGDFVPLAEQSGLIEEIGEHVLREACAQVARWQTEGLPLSVAVNLSGRQLRDPRLPELVESVLAQTGVAASMLVLELTESQLVERTDETITLLHRLRRLGVRIAVDDFGTGYSSLSYLSRFPLDILKVDRSFVERCAEESDEAELTRTIVRLAQSLHLTTVAEGIEEIGQLEALRAMGCDCGQGYLFSAARDGIGVARLARATMGVAAIEAS
jgi:EAL domain-containing protein (putative c-di-GMP-specific phosphodiesterase class I)